MCLIFLSEINNKQRDGSPAHFPSKKTHKNRPPDCFIGKFLKPPPVSLIYYYPCVNLVIVERSGEIEKIITVNLFCVFIQRLYP